MLYPAELWDRNDRLLSTCYADRRVWRIVLIFAAFLLVGDATGLLPEGDAVACNDEPDGKQCPPTDCPTCTCGWHSTQRAPAIRVEITPIVVSSRTIESPIPVEAHGRLAPPPMLRPPIRAS